MQGPRSRLLMIGAIFLCCLFAGNAGAEKLKEDRGEEKPNPIIINSKTLEVNNEQKTVTFLGDVSARQEDMVITCQKVIVYYESLPNQKGSDKDETRVRKILASGDLKIERAGGGTATAEQAVYLPQDEKIILTGKSIVKQGNDLVEGDRITIFLKENRSVVEGSEDKKVRAVIFPGRGKR